MLMPLPLSLPVFLCFFFAVALCFIVDLFLTAEPALSPALIITGTLSWERLLLFSRLSLQVSSLGFGLRGLVLNSVFLLLTPRD